MESGVLIPLIFAGLFLIIEIVLFIRMISLLKKSKNDTVEERGNKLNPFLYATAIVSVAMGISMIFMTVIK